LRLARRGDVRPGVERDVAADRVADSRCGQQPNFATRRPRSEVGRAQAGAAFDGQGLSGSELHQRSAVGDRRDPARDSQIARVGGQFDSAGRQLGRRVQELVAAAIANRDRTAKI
jgi:hypothetical protein